MAPGRMDDGTEFEVRPGDIFDVPPGHDNWVVGDEPMVAVIWGGWRGWGKPPAGERILTTIICPGLSLGSVGAEVPGNHEIGQPGLFWPEILPGSGELQHRDRGSRELDPDPLQRTRIASPGAAQCQRQLLHGGVVPDDQQSPCLRRSLAGQFQQLASGGPVHPLVKAHPGRGTKLRHGQLPRLAGTLGC